MKENNASRRDLKIVIIGGGMAGILAAARLRQTGHRQVTLYEKADRVGGTWRDNTYPGLNCDVPAHAYTYSFAPNPNWSSYLAGGAEVFAYFEGVMKEQAIESWIRYNEEVTSCIFENGRWHIETAKGHKDTADVVIAATGVLHHPNYPDIAGAKISQRALESRCPAGWTSHWRYRQWIDRRPDCIGACIARRQARSFPARQWAYIEQLIAQLESGVCREISVTKEAMADYDQRRITAAKKTIFASGCSSWYLDAEGVPSTWPWSYDRFAEEMSRPELDSFDIVA